MPRVEYPLSAGIDGVKIRPELMEREKLYHCIFKNKVMLLFKDAQDFLNCYEIEEEALVSRVRGCRSDTELERIFEDYLGEQDRHA